MARIGTIFSAEGFPKSPHKMEELNIAEIKRDYVNFEVLATLSILLCDYIGQHREMFLSVIDIILCQIFSRNIFLGDKVIV